MSTLNIHNITGRPQPGLHIQAGLRLILHIPFAIFSQLCVLLCNVVFFHENLYVKKNVFSFLMYSILYRITRIASLLVAFRYIGEREK